MTTLNTSVDPLQVATRGYFNSPLAVATQGYIYIVLDGEPEPKPKPIDSAGGGGMQVGGYEQSLRRMNQLQEEEDFIRLAVEALLFILRG